MTTSKRIPKSASTDASSRRFGKATRLLPGLLAATLAAGACTSDDPSTGAVDLNSDSITLTSGLTTLQTCDELLDQLIAHGLERVGPYGFGGNQYGMRGGDMVLEEMAMDDTAMSGEANTSAAAPTAVAESGNESAGSDGDFSGTNNQEGGVDEGDFVKTDGKRLVVANGSTIRVLDVTGNSPVLVHTIQLDEYSWANEMFLVGDTLLVMSQGWNEHNEDDSASSRVGWDIMPMGSPTTSLTEIDLNTGSVGETMVFEGNYLSGREIDGSIRLVLNTNIGQFPFVYPNSEGAEDAAEKTNRQLLQDSTIEQWLPSLRTGENSGEALIPCDQVHIPSTFSGFGTLAVLTVGLDGGLSVSDSLGVLTEGQTIYASTDRLAVATTRWQGDFTWSEDGQVEGDDSYSTSLHSFDISNPDSTTYVASGSVPGHLLNQFSMSEHEGNLRVAVTEGSPWNDQSSESSVVVLSESGNELVTIGSVGGLGKGETIQSVRFMGDTAYVVTFRQTDPLYTIDLADPTAPAVTGELKIPGFSAYLHPLSEDRLMGVGQDGTDEGQLLGAQLSIFDVADMANPTRIATFGFGQDSNTPVGWDAKSFTWWAPTQTAFVPVNQWSWNEGNDESSADVVAVQVAEDGTMTELGRISHPAEAGCESYFYEDEEDFGKSSDDATSAATPAPANDKGEAVSDQVDAEAELIEPAPPVAPDNLPQPSEEYCWSYQPELRRTVIIGETVYTVSDAGVQANSMDDFSATGWVSFQN